MSGSNRAAAAPKPMFVFGRNTMSPPLGPTAGKTEDISQDMTKLDELLANLNMREGPEAVLRELKNRYEKFKEMSVNPR